MTEKIQVGKIPTVEDKFWIEIANNTTPDKSIERLDTQAKFLFSTVSIIGILLTGFGIFGTGGSNVLRNPWFVLPVTLACLSLALSMIGLTPKVDSLNRHDINSVRNYYNNLITRRGRFIFWASITFSLSLLSVAFVLAYPLKPLPITSAISISLADTDGKTKLTGKIDLQDLPPSGIAETEIVGHKDNGKDSQQTTLFKDISHVDSSGKMTISVQLDEAKDYKWFVISSKITTNSKLVHEKKVEVKR